MRSLSKTELSQISKILNEPSLFSEVESLRQMVMESFAAQGGRWFSADMLDNIILWKLDRQYPRSRDLRRLNLDPVVVPVTKAALEVESNSFDYEVEIRLKLLTSLRGVATPIASSVLAFSEPDRFAVIDSLLWRFLYGQDKSAFTARDYLVFLSDLEPIAQRFRVSTHTFEHALWLMCSDQ